MIFFTSSVYIIFMFFFKSLKMVLLKFLSDNSSFCHLKICFYWLLLKKISNNFLFLQITENHCLDSGHWNFIVEWWIVLCFFKGFWMSYEDKNYLKMLSRCVCVLIWGWVCSSLYSKASLAPQRKHDPSAISI